MSLSKLPSHMATLSVSRGRSKLDGSLEVSEATGDCLREATLGAGAGDGDVVEELRRHDVGERAVDR